ncbi:MAG TPA: aspartate--tRNA ligase [Planctomycetota bacterium]
MSRSTTLRTHGCGDLRGTDAGAEVVLCGWVDARRDHGGVSFIDLRDRFGTLQVVADDDSPSVTLAAIQALHPEECLRIRGTVRMRDAEHRNSKRPTGDVEVLALEIEMLGPAARLPLEVSDTLDAPEELRMRYRYLDLRREPMKRLMVMRSRANHALRSALQELEFVEIETPMLTRSTPEGARDYLVPSRVRPGSWYALPQSPQIFKQLCMVAGLDRYFQIARCLRDEDLRADRQPEFTQLDLEMSFVGEEDIWAMVEHVVCALYRETKGVELPAPFERMPYAEAMLRFACDKPDLRNPLEVVDLAETAAALGFGVFDSALAGGGLVRGIRIPGGGRLARKQIEELERTAKDSGAGGAAWCKVGDDGLPTGPLARFLKEPSGAAFLAAAGMQPGDLLVTAADRPRRALGALDAMRRRAADLLELDLGADRLVWITEFPLFEATEDGGWAPAHHPFTSPVAADLPRLLAGEKDGVRSRAYDLVLNGVELGSGSIRIHRPDVQEAVFAAIGLAPAEARRRFSFLLEAFQYGPPPHGGFAIGLDRLYALLFGAASIREVIAFPKTSSGSCPLTGAPTPVDLGQLQELGLIAQGAPLEESKNPV